MRGIRVLAVGALLVLATATGAGADDSRSTTRDGRTLTASKAVGLNPAGERVRVRGTGYDRSKGIYVAFCVDNGPGKVPTPCGGGADTEGSSGNSVWISDFPPAYGAGLAQPYGEGGSFDVEIGVRARLREDDPDTDQDETVDCRTTRCAVVTRNDHTRSDDRSQDVAVPVSFAREAAPAAGAPAPAPSSAVGAPPSSGARGFPSAAPTAGTASTTGSPTASPGPASSSPSSRASTPSPTAPAGGGDAAISGGSVAAASASERGSGVPTPLLTLVAAAVCGVGAVLVRRRLRGRGSDVA